jgi:hypothetical protein
MNKFGSSPHVSRRVRTNIDGVAIADLVEQYGSPLFVFSEQRLRWAIREAKTVFYQPLSQSNLRLVLQDQLPGRHLRTVSPGG